MFGLLATAMCLIARVFSVFPCGAIVNLMKHVQSEPNTLSWQRLVMMWHSGLRGGIALVLALEVNAEWCDHKATIVNGTFVVICVLLNFMGIKTHEDAAEDALVVQNRYYVKMFSGLHYAGALVMAAPENVKEEGEE